MVLMEIVICLHVLVSIEHSKAAVATYMVRLWGTRVRNPQMVFFLCYSQDESGQTWRPELGSTSLEMIDW